MNLTTKSEYGIRALTYIRDNQNRSPINITEISDELNLSKTYIEQIFRILKKADILESYRGKDGGYSLTRKPSEIVIGDIIRALEGEIALSSKCEEDCKVENCSSKEVYKRIDFAVSNVIDKITLQDI